MFELEEVRTWERNPQFYADIARVEPRRAGALRLRAGRRAGPPRAVEAAPGAALIQAARDNIKDPPGIFVKVGIETMRGALKFIDDDLPRAFVDVDDLHLLGDLADAQTEAAQAIGAYIEYLETDVAPEGAGVVPPRPRQFEQKLRLEEGITLPVDRLLAIATRELAGDAGGVPPLAGRHERRRSARGVGARRRTQHPAPGELVAVGRAAARRARRRFSSARRIVTLPAGEPVTVAPTPDFYRWSFASMWTPGPVRDASRRAPTTT